MSYSGSVKIFALLGASTLMSGAFMSGTAYAGCGMTCGSSHGGHSAPALSTWTPSSSYTAPSSSYSSSSTYSSSYTSSPSYTSGASYTSGSMAANCPSGTSPQSDGTCLDTSGRYSSTTSYNSVSSSPVAVGGVSLPTTYSGMTTTSYGASSDAVTLPTTYGPVGSSMSVGRTSRSYSAPYSASTYSSGNYGSGSISATYSDTSATIVPFTSSASIPGLGANERLVATDCPVSVYNPGGGKVLGCYAVSKPAPVVRYAPPRVNYTRVVRPVIYVRYPVPTPVPYVQDVYVGHYGNACGGNYTRYGAGYPGSCGW